MLRFLLRRVGGCPPPLSRFFSVRGEGKATLKYLLKLLVFKLEGGNCNHYFLQVMLEKKRNAADLLLTICILTLIVAHSIFQFSP